MQFTYGAVLPTVYPVQFTVQFTWYIVYITAFTCVNCTVYSTVYMVHSLHYRFYMCTVYSRVYNVYRVYSFSTDNPYIYVFNPIHAGVLENQYTLGGGVNFAPPPPLNPMFDVQI